MQRCSTCGRLHRSEFPDLSFPSSPQLTRPSRCHHELRLHRLFAWAIGRNCSFSLGLRPLPEDGSCGEAHSNEWPRGHDSEIVSSPKSWQIKHFSNCLNLILRPTLNCKVISCHFTAEKTKVQRGDPLTQVQKDLSAILSGTALHHAACQQRTRKRGS